MGELSIRPDRDFSVSGFQRIEKAVKQSGVSQTQGQSASSEGDITISETLRNLMARLNQTAGRSQESLRLMQTGESTLAEVQSRLDRMAELAEAAENGSASDRATLQKEIEQLCDEIDRVLEDSISDGLTLFSDSKTSREVAEIYQNVEEELTELLQTVTESVTASESSAAEQDAAKILQWLLEGIADNASAADILASLGLDATATPEDLLAALSENVTEGSALLARLASLYLGATIAGDGSAENTDIADALQGLQQFLAALSDGVSPEQALQELTNGALLLSNFEQLFSGTIDLQLLNALSGLFLTSDTAASELSAEAAYISSDPGSVSFDLLAGAMKAMPSASAETALSPESSPPLSVGQFGPFQVSGRDLSGVEFNAAAKALFISGAGEVTIEGPESLLSGQAAASGQTLFSVVLTGSGTVTLRDANMSMLAVDSPNVQINSEGKTVLHTLQFREGAAVSLGGDGLLEIGRVKGNVSNRLAVTGGAVIVGDGSGELPLGSVQVEGAASLAAQSAIVQDTSGRALQPFDVVWQTLLPGWNNVTAMEIDGQQAQMLLYNNSIHPDLMRLWLDKGVNLVNGHPIHIVTIYGRDDLGNTITHYAYLRWNESAGAFQQTIMYPNPFTVTGGAEGTDWIYEEASQTLHILTNRVTDIAGGSGVDLTRNTFSGRIALTDSIGSTELTLGGVDCRVSSGRAFSLGKENNVTILLQNGSSNVFESGGGFAGISVGSGSSLTIDRSRSDDETTAMGTLTAIGGRGGAGIGRDSGSSSERVSRLIIRGGEVNAIGSGAGAGIGAGKYGSIGAIRITGGAVSATGGKNGGAGIGGALGGSVGDIALFGGNISAVSVCHAAAIGASAQGSCGDILITGTARIVKAQGGTPGSDIGACVFGKCGKITISGGADIGGAHIKHWTPEGIPLQMGGETITLPRLFFSSETLLLNKVDVTTRENARAARNTINTASRRISRVQTAYNALGSQLDQNINSIWNARQYISAAENLIRDTGVANALLTDTAHSILRQSAQAMRTHSEQNTDDIRRLLR